MVHTVVDLCQSGILLLVGQLPSRHPDCRTSQTVETTETPHCIPDLVVDYYIMKWRL